MPKTPRTGGPKRKARAKKSQAGTTKPAGKRILQPPRRIWYKPLTWRHRPPVPAYRPLSKARILFWNLLKQLWAYKALFGGIVLIYGILNLVLVRGLAGSNDLSSLKSTLDGVLHGFGGEMASFLASFSYLVISSGSGSTETSGVYQGVLLTICSLAFIWAFRQSLAKHRPRIRDSFYLGMYPLIPFLLVFLLLCVQLIPMAIGTDVYTAVSANGIAIHAWEKAFWFILMILLDLWSLRMATATIFALYIVSLPDMTPWRAYRNARQLVYGRRLLIWRKLIFLPILLLLAAAIIELPLILFLTPVAVWMFFILSMLALPLVHGYLYNLYREML